MGGEVEARARVRQGFAFAVAAYGLWGLVPIYFKALADVPPAEVLAHRIAWSAPILAAMLALGGRARVFARCMASPRMPATLLASTLCIATNWFVYIYAVSSSQLLHASLGYFMNPLVNVVLGLAVLSERLRPLQWVAVGFAALGVVVHTAMAGGLPWISLTLALSFGLYGLLRKVVAVEAVAGMAVEIALLLPLALAYLWLTGSAWQHDGTATRALLVASGAVTTFPLLCFVGAARRLPLTTIGFLQYLSPTISFVVAVALFHEPFDTKRLLGFLCIWAGLVVYSFDALPRRSARLRGLTPPAQQESSGG